MLNEPELLRSALEATPVGLYLVDRECKVVLWSNGAERITGHMRQEVIGHSCRDNLLDPCDAAGSCVCENACPLGALTPASDNAERVLYLKHKDGHRLPVRVYATPLRNSAGVVLGAMESFHEQRVVTARPARCTDALNAHATLRSGAIVATRPLTLAVVREALHASRTQGIGCAVACVEIAHFHEFRTTHTQTAAAQMMDSISASIRQTLRQTDQVGRWSDSQLLVTLPGCHSSALEAVVTRIAGVARQSRIRWWGDELSANVWIGAVMARPDEGADEVAARAVAATRQCADRGYLDDPMLIQI
jgi:PAS domain S-box-containing protein